MRCTSPPTAPGGFSGRNPSPFLFGCRSRWALLETRAAGVAAAGALLRKAAARACLVQPIHVAEFRARSGALRRGLFFQAHRAITTAGHLDAGQRGANARTERPRIITPVGRPLRLVLFATSTQESRERQRRKQSCCCQFQRAPPLWRKTKQLLECQVPRSGRSPRRAPSRSSTPRLPAAVFRVAERACRWPL